jgi:hypothetical protein
LAILTNSVPWKQATNRSSGLFYENPVTINRRQLFSGAAAIATSGNLWSEEEAVKVTSENGVLELRQYTLRGGQRDTLISMFERRFLEPQNALGAHVIGTFRDLDDPDRFVWIRGFRDTAMRRQALEAFYGGSVWQANKAAANTTMLDSDNVLLLRPVGPGQGFAPQSSSNGESEGIIGASIYYLGSTDAMQFAQFFERSMVPNLALVGVQPIACLVTEEVPNNFPRLPIREHDRTFIWFARWPSVDAEDAFVARFSTLSGWRDSAPDSVLPALMRKPERLRLLPTQRSFLR